MKFTLKSFMLMVLQATLILVPLTWTSSTSELFEFPKMILTYAGATILVGLWLARMVSTKKIIYRRTPFELPILLFLLSQTISTLLSINPHTSIFGYYSRFNGGLLSLFSYAAIYFTVVSNFDYDDARRIVGTLIFTALVSSIYAFPEHFGHSPSCAIISGEFNASCWVQDVQNRIFGTFGQPNWLAAYLVAIIPITLFLAVFGKDTRRRGLYAAGTVFCLATIAFTKSQSGIGATAVALGLAAVLISIKLKKPQLILGLAAVCAIGVFAKPAAVEKTFASLNNINPFYSTTAAIVAHDNATRMNGGNDSMVIRRIVWEGALKLAMQHPLFGSGVETFGYAYYGVRPVEHNLISEWDFLYNKAHNEFLNYAATTGFVGLATYLLFLISFILWSLKLVLKENDQTLDTKFQTNSKQTPTDSLNLSRSMIAAFLVGFVALCVSNFFGFSTVPVNTLLFLFPGLAVLLGDELMRRPDDESTQKDLEKPIQQKKQSYVQSKKNSLQSRSQNRLAEPLTNKQIWGFWAVGLVTTVVLYRILVGYTADISYAAGKSADSTQHLSEAAKELQTAIQMVPDEPLYTDQLSLTASEVAADLYASGKTQEASQAAAIAIGLSDRTLQLNPYHLNFYKTRSKLFINLSAIDPRYAVEAGVTLDKAIHLAPTDAKLWFNRALLTYQLGFKEDSLGIYKKTIELKPNYDLARFQYGKALASLGKYDEAKTQYEYILTQINPGNTQVETALAEVATRSASKK